MRLFNSSVSDASPSSYRSPPIDVDADDTHDPDEILQMDRRGISDVSLSTRLTLRKNNEPAQSDDPGDKSQDLPKRKRGRPRKGSEPIPKSPKKTKSSLKQTKITFSKKAAPEAQVAAISAVIRDLDEVFKSTRHITSPVAFEFSSLSFTELLPGTACSPLVAQKDVANIGVLKISPLKNYGPFINAQRGFIVMIILNTEAGKLEFDSGYSNLQPAKCDSNTQLMVCPNDMFMLSNTSKTVEAEILIICCYSMGNDKNHLEDIKYAYSF